MDPFEAFAPVQVDPSKPAPPPAKIRPYDANTDLKLVRYLVGAGVMEPSSLANRIALFKPVSLIICLALAHILTTTLTSGYPALIHNYFYSTPKPVNPDAPLIQTIADLFMLLPLFLGPPIIVLAVFELRHRALFEAEMRRAIGEEDLRSVETYYGAIKEGENSDDTKSKAKKDEAATVTGQQPEQRKGFWVLEYDNRLIGAIGLDGRKPGQPLESIIDQIGASNEKDKKDENETAASIESSSTTATAPFDSLRSRSTLKSLTPATSSSMAPSLSVTPPTPSSGVIPYPFPLNASPLPEGTLHLRRFATSLSFRSADIEDDLLDFAAREAFEPLAAPDAPSPAKQLVLALRPTVQKDLRKRLENHGWILVPRGSELEVPLVGHAAGTVAVPKSFGEMALEAIWPLSLEVRTMVLKRSTWEDKRKDKPATQ
ncbi:hypothetical protein JCM1841_006736 [Sporobolomyces salmonicolor]